MLTSQNDCPQPWCGRNANDSECSGAFSRQSALWKSPEAAVRVVVGIQTDTRILGNAFYIEGRDDWESGDCSYPM